MHKLLLVAALLAASSASAETPGEAEEIRRLDPMSLLDRDGTVSLTAEGGSSLGQGFGGVAAEARGGHLLSGRVFMDAEIHLGFAGFVLSNIYLTLAARAGFWFPLGPLLVGPYLGVAFDAPPGGSPSYSFDFGSVLELPVTRRLAIDVTPRLLATYQGVAAFVLDTRAAYRVNRNFDAVGGVRYEKLNRGNAADTVVTIFAGISL